MADEVNGSLYFQLKLDGREGSGLFTEANGGGSENAVIEQKVQVANGGVQIRKIPGNLKFNDVTLKRGVDKDLKLWEWRDQVVKGEFKKARCNGTLTMLDSEMQIIATYTFVNGWPSKYTPASMNASQDQAAVEEITITVEEYKRV